MLLNCNCVVSGVVNNVPLEPTSILISTLNEEVLYFSENHAYLPDYTEL